MQSLHLKKIGHFLDWYTKSTRGLNDFECGMVVACVRRAGLGISDLLIFTQNRL